MNTKSAKTDAVSTRSRPKAAGCRCRLPLRRTSGFNTQPPKGGWHSSLSVKDAVRGFNTQPPEGGWGRGGGLLGKAFVSTHSRLKAAGTDSVDEYPALYKFQHTAT